MAFNNVFVGQIAAGETVGVSYRFPNGADLGAQYAQARGVGPGIFRTLNQGVQKKIIPNEQRFDVIYLLTVESDPSNPDTDTLYEISGGSLT
jgi:hypothetical protein